MNQTQKRNLILQQQWTEAGGAIVPAPPRMPQPLRDPDYRPSVQPERQRVIDKGRLTTLVNRQLVYLVGDLMGSVKIVDGYGRIAVVKFTPMQQIDPVMPVPLVEFSGWSGYRHKLAFRKMTGLLMRLEQRWFPVNTSKWYHTAKRTGDVLIGTSRTFLTADEWQYYSDQVIEMVTNPFRVEWKV